MELNSFKAILLRKADGNNNLQFLIQNVGEDFLVDSVVEALEKMALPTNNSGKNANAPITSFGANIDKTDINQLRDALGHHLSHYKAALKAHHAAPEGPEKVKMRQVADQHLNHLFPLMHLASRAGRHSNGKLNIDYPSIPPWETNYTRLDRNAKGDGPLRDPKLLAARPSKGARRDKPGATGTPDYHFLEMPPHPGHEANATMPHTSGYPWEEVQVGSPSDIDAKKAYLHIEDIPNKTEYTPHEFDQHPIRSVQDIQANYMSPEQLQSYADAVANWRNSDPHKQWLANQREKFTADREGYLARGQKKAPHFYEGIPLKEQEQHAKNHPPVAKKQPPAAQDKPVPAPAQGASKQPIDVNSLPKSLRHLVPGAVENVQSQKTAQNRPTSEAQASKARTAFVRRALADEEARVRAGKPSGAPAPTPVPAPQQVPAQAPAAAANPDDSLERSYQAWRLLPTAHQQTIMNAIPGLADYIAKKGGK